MKLVMKQLSILAIAALLLSGFLRFHHHDSAGLSHSIVSELIHHSLHHYDSPHEDDSDDNICHHHQGASDCKGDCNLTINLIDNFYNAFNTGFIHPKPLTIGKAIVIYLSTPQLDSLSIVKYQNPYLKHLRRRGPPCFIV